jgi:hypothetical protein
VNPSPADRTALVRFDAVPPADAAAVVLELPGGSTVPTQEVGRPERALFAGPFEAAVLREAIIRRSFGQEMFSRRIQRWEHADWTVTFHVGRVGDPGVRHRRRRGADRRAGHRGRRVVDAADRGRAGALAAGRHPGAGTGLDRRATGRRHRPVRP